MRCWTEFASLRSQPARSEWLRFWASRPDGWRCKPALREDLVKRLKVGDQFQMRVSALGDRVITAAVKVIAAKGEYGRLARHPCDR